MKFYITQHDGHSVPYHFNRSSACLQHCQVCRGLDPITGGIYLVVGCPRTECSLYKLRLGGSLKKLGITIEEQAKMIRWHCLRCVGKGEVGRFQDVMACPSKSCPLHPFRAGGFTEFDAGHYCVLGKKSYAKLMWRDPQDPDAKTIDPAGYYSQTAIEPPAEAPVVETSEPEGPNAVRLPTLEEYLAACEPPDFGVDVTMVEQSLIR